MVPSREPAGLGFTGIAIALLGCNHPAGIAIGALPWGFLDSSAQILNLRDVPVEIVQITQGVIVLSVVVGWWYASTDSLPSRVMFAMPYLTTLLVMALASQRLRMPKADGVVYRKGTAK